MHNMFYTHQITLVSLSWNFLWFSDKALDTICSFQSQQLKFSFINKMVSVIFIILKVSHFPLKVKRFDCALVSVHLKATGLNNEDLGRLQGEIDNIPNLIDAIQAQLPGQSVVDNIPNLIDIIQTQLPGQSDRQHSQPHRRHTGTAARSVSGWQHSQSHRHHTGTAARSVRLTTFPTS